MATIRVKIIDSTANEAWFASAWCPNGKTPEQTVKTLNAKAKLVHHIGTITYELATEEQYQAYRSQLRNFS